MARKAPYVFISYKHEKYTTRVTKMFFDKLLNYQTGLGLSGVFMDKGRVKAGDPWREDIRAALEQTTHFVVMLTDAYWQSDECRRELAYALDRYHSGGSDQMRLLFVQVQQIAPDLLVFKQDDPDAKVGLVRVKKGLSKIVPDLQTVGDLQFLGPFDKCSRLVRLPTEDPLRDDALFQLVQRLKETLPIER